MPSIFSRILAGDIPGAFVHRDALWAVMLDINPVAPGHLLLVPIHEAALLPELPAATLAALGALLARADRCLRAATGCAAVSVLLRDGPEAGQEVPHVHLHLIPRAAGDDPHAFAGGSYGPDRQVALETMRAALAAAWLECAA